MTPQEELAHVAELKRELPAMQAAAIERARNGGMTWREIAAILKITERAVYKAHRRDGSA